MPIGGVDTSVLGNFVVVPNAVSYPTGINRYPGKLVFQADILSFFWWNGSTWVDLSVGGGGGGVGNGPNMLVVASSTADATVLARADYMCDGSADEVEINAALARGNVLLTCGDYTISTPILITRPGGALYGTGLGENMTGTAGRGFGTLIKLASAFTGVAGILVQNSSSLPAGQCSLSNFKIDGAANKTANPGGGIHGIRFRSYQGNIDRMVVRNCSGDGFNIRGFTSGEAPPNGWSTYDTKLNMLFATGCGGAGLNLDSGAADCHVSNSIFAANDGSGVHGGVSVQATNVHTYGNSLHGWHLENVGSRHKLANCKIEHNLLHGFYLEGTTAGASGVQIANTGFNCNGKGTDNTFSHIGVTGTFSATSLELLGCEFGNSDGVANLAKYCIDLGAVGIGVTITACHFGTTIVTSGARTGKINASGSSLTKMQISGCNNMQDHHASPTTTIAAGAGGGASPPTPIISGNDQRGQITWGTGTGPTTGIQATITFGFPWEVAGITPIVVPANAAAAALIPYVLPADTSLTAWSFRVQTAGAASQGASTYAIQYHLMS